MQQLVTLQVPNPQPVILSPGKGRHHTHDKSVVETVLMQSKLHAQAPVRKAVVLPSAAAPATAVGPQGATLARATAGQVRR